MKFIVYPLLLVLFLASCKKNMSNEKQLAQHEKDNVIQVSNIEEKIANAYGIKNWQKVRQVDFSFVVNPGTEKEFSRRWSWQPKTHEVTMINDKDTITYNRKKISEEAINTDKGFVNDSFWLLFPFHLVWDDVEILTYENQLSPILKQTTTKLRVNYPDKGGYTPGDSYEVYIDEDYHIVEWTHHRGGSIEPGLGNTFENRQSFGGIMIDMEHANPAIGFQLNFRDVVIK
jgi:hypothetical protein